VLSFTKNVHRQNSATLGVSFVGCYRPSYFLAITDITIISILNNIFTPMFFMYFVVMSINEIMLVLRLMFSSELSVTTVKTQIFEFCFYIKRVYDLLVITNNELV